MKKSTLGTIAIATGILLNMTAGIMMLVQLVKVIGFGQLVLMNDLGKWVTLFKADAGYSWLMIGIAFAGMVIFVMGKVLVQMEKDELRASKRFSF